MYNTRTRGPVRMGNWWNDTVAAVANFNLWNTVQNATTGQLTFDQKVAYAQQAYNSVLNAGGTVAQAQAAYNEVMNNTGAAGGFATGNLFSPTGSSASAAGVTNANNPGGTNINAWLIVGGLGLVGAMLVLQE